MIRLRHLLAAWAVRVASAVAALATVIATTAAVKAARLEPLPLPDDGSAGAVTVVQAAARTANDLIDAAVAAAPFTPGRTPTVNARPEPVAAAFEPLPVTLVGTVVGGDNDSFVLVSAGTGPAKVVRVGGVFEGLRLRSVGQASAVFNNVQTGERLELTVPRSRP